MRFSFLLIREWVLVTFIVCSVMSVTAEAGLTIEINHGNTQAVSVAVVPFSSNSNRLLPVDVASVISNDLRLSGQFSPVSQDDFLSFPNDAKSVYYPDWQKLNVRYLVLGKVNVLVDNHYRVSYQLFDINNRKSILSGYVEGSTGQLRSLAHSISDQVYQKITGVRGNFSTKLLYVLAQRKGTDSASYQLVYADMDGHRPVTIVTSSQPIVSPAWSPDRRQVAYVNYTNNLRQVIYVQNLATGSRRVVSPKGFALATSPAFSPNGEWLAMTLSKGRDSHLYMKNLNTGQLKQVTFGHYILDSEPSWTPDGKNIMFTSNRGGSAQLYEVDIASDKVKRLTFEGGFNARARVFPDGKSIALVTKGVGERAYHIAILDMVTGKMRILSTEPFEDSPSISPNGRMLVFSALKGNHHVLGMVTSDGRASFTLPAKKGDVQEPAWSPYL